MAYLNEASLAELLVQLEAKMPHPTSLVVTDEGIELQAQRMRDGDLTEEDMRAAGVPDDLIAETKARAGK